MAETNAPFGFLSSEQSEESLILRSYTVTKDIQRCFAPLNMTNTFNPRRHSATRAFLPQLHARS
jgi:hypothetical protein